MKKTARDRAHPVETHPLGARPGLSAEETDRLVDDLEREALVKRTSWQAGPVTITEEGEREVEAALLEMERRVNRPPVGFRPGRDD